MKKNLLVAFMLILAGNTFANTKADTLVVTTNPRKLREENKEQHPLCKGYQEDRYLGKRAKGNHNLRF